MKKRILSAILSMAVVATISTFSVTEAKASDDEQKCIDGSYLTTEESSTGYSSSPDMRGQYIMVGECSISKAGLTRVYCYGSTTANFEVDHMMTIVYVDQYLEDLKAWGQVDYFYVEDYDDYFQSTAKSIKVDRGHYYRVHCDHIIHDNGEGEETYSYTNGILLP